MHHSVHALFWDTAVLILIQETVRRCWAQQSARFLHKQHSAASVCSWLEEKAQRATLEGDSAEHQVGAGTPLTSCYKLKKKWTLEFLCHWEGAVRAEWWNVCNVRHSLQPPNVFLMMKFIASKRQTAVECWPWWRRHPHIWSCRFPSKYASLKQST